MSLTIAGMDIKKKGSGAENIIASCILLALALSLPFFIKHNFEKEMEKVAAGITEQIVSISASQPELNEQMLNKLVQKDYNEIKKELETTKDFCIYLEDGDGNVVTVMQGLPGVGSGEITINDEPCSW